MQRIENAISKLYGNARAMWPTVLVAVYADNEQTVWTANATPMTTSPLMECLIDMVICGPLIDESVLSKLAKLACHTTVDATIPFCGQRICASSAFTNDLNALYRELKDSSFRWIVIVDDDGIPVNVNGSTSVGDMENAPMYSFLYTVLFRWKKGVPCTVDIEDALTTLHYDMLNDNSAILEDYIRRFSEHLE